MDARDPNASKVARRLFAAEIDFVALSSRPVTGTVRDADTGKPLSGVRVANWHFAGSFSRGTMVIDTITDAAGQFRLTGMPVGEGNQIMIVPGSDQPFFSQQAAVAVDAKLDPIPLDIGLHRGIWIAGRVTDKATGKPVSAVVDWFPYRSNEFAQKRTPEFKPNGRRQGWTNHRTSHDGTYRVVGLPGRAIVGASANAPHNFSYRLGAGAENLDQAAAQGSMPAGMLPRTVWPADSSNRFQHSLKRKSPFLQMPSRLPATSFSIPANPCESPSSTPPENHLQTSIVHADTRENLTATNRRAFEERHSTSPPWAPVTSAISLRTPGREATWHHLWIELDPNARASKRFRWSRARR